MAWFRLIWKFCPADVGQDVGQDVGLDIGHWFTYSILVLEALFSSSSLQYGVYMQLNISQYIS